MPSVVWNALRPRAYGTTAHMRMHPEMRTLVVIRKGVASSRASIVRTCRVAFPSNVRSTATAQSRRIENWRPFFCRSTIEHETANQCLPLAQGQDRSCDRSWRQQNPAIVASRDEKRLPTVFSKASASEKELEYRWGVLRCLKRRAVAVLLLHYRPPTRRRSQTRCIPQGTF